MHKTLFFLLAGTFLSGNALADEQILLKSNNSKLTLSIYNQDLALVKDIRQADIKAGTSEIVFDGVAQQIQPETAMLYGQDIKVLEQNYSYNVITYENLVNQSVGQEVTTVRQNPQTGENIFEKAYLIGSTYGQPVLKFPYGIETNFSGRIVFDKIPTGVSDKPTLTAKINNKKSGAKNLFLAYLTGGLSWKTDYVATISNKNQLDLTGWVTINNNTGVDYNNAKIQLIAGEVNAVRNVVKPRMMMAKMSMAVMNDSVESAGLGSVTPEQISNYELYTLPAITSIKDKQTKQIGLIEKSGVKYAKEFNFNSPLHFVGNYEFEKMHPEITYVLENNKTSNLGISLPAGTMRFYENDKNGSLQFIGSANIGNTAKEEKLRLNLGQAFNLTIAGKISKVSEKEIERKPQNKCYNVKVLKTHTAETTISNADTDANSVIISQSFPDTAKLLKESHKGTLKNASTKQWTVSVPANGKTTLSFTVQIPQDTRICD
mgnify:FL=1